MMYLKLLSVSSGLEIIMRKKNLFILFLWLSGIVAGMQFAKFSSTIGLIQTEVVLTHYTVAGYSLRWAS